MNHFDLNKCEKFKSADQSSDSEAENVSPLYEAQNQGRIQSFLCELKFLTKLFGSLNAISRDDLTFIFRYSCSGEL